jgi:Endoglucanase
LAITNQKQHKKHLTKKSIETILIIIGALLIVAMVIGVIMRINSAKDLDISRSINIGNALEAPKGIPWDVELKNEHFDTIKEAGFDTVRLPVRFSDYAINNEGYILDEDFMQKVDGHIDYALNTGLIVILDFHHFDEIMEDPLAYKDCFLAIWKQVSERYKYKSEKLYFELLNEPHNNLTGDIWNQLINEATALIRETNPSRQIIIGPVEYNSMYRLDDLRLPDDRNIIVTVHYYYPPEFTFQNDQYHPEYKKYINVDWGSVAEVKQVAADFDQIKSWSKKNNRGIYLGEFGANKSAPSESRAKYISTIRSIAEENKFAWGYWEFASGFGLYDQESEQWDERIKNALIPENQY